MPSFQFGDKMTEIRPRGMAPVIESSSHALVTETCLYPPVLLRLQTSTSHQGQGLPQAAFHLNLYPACNPWLLPGEPCGLRNPKHSLQRVGPNVHASCPQHPIWWDLPIFQLLILLYFHYILYFYRLFYIKVFLDSVQLLYNKFYCVCSSPLYVFISTLASQIPGPSCATFPP